MSNIIKSISIENYRGFKTKQVLELTAFNDITFLVGQNNTGKSLITRLFNIFDGITNVSTIISFTNNDFFDLQTDKPIHIIFELNKDFLLTKSKFNLLSKFDDVLLGFFVNKEPNKEFRRYCYLETNNVKSHVLENDTFDYNSNFGQQINIDRKDKVEGLIGNLIDFITNTFLVFEPIRAFDKEQQNSYFKTGKELINWINDKSDSDIALKVKRKIKEYFNELNLECPDDVNTDEDKKLFVFSFGDLKLTSNEVGTGYSMLYILLMELLRNENKHLVIIDEIESHLQPGLIRVLIRILREIEVRGTKRNVQYILATHSPTVIESAKEKDFLYRFQKFNQSCTFYKFFRAKDDLTQMRQACNDLGVIPGDALLSNIVIWVEGPTEILWLRKLLEIYLPEYKDSKNKTSNIIEGLHFSILMTGGGLISNLSFDEQDFDISMPLTEQYLKVLRVNPNPFVIIDFDAVEPTHEKYKRSLRIANEINDNNKNHVDRIKDFLNPDAHDITTKDKADEIKNFWWMKAKELENYCPPRIIKDFYKHYNDNKRSNVEDWGNVTDWNVYSAEKGVGTLLEERGIKEVKAKSGTIKHKQKLAEYLNKNLKPDDLEENTDYPNKPQLDDLKENLDKLLDYIYTINDLK